MTSGLRKAAESGDSRMLNYPLPAVIMEDSTPLQEAGLLRFREGVLLLVILILLQLSTTLLPII